MKRIAIFLMVGIIILTACSPAATSTPLPSTSTEVPVMNTPVSTTSPTTAPTIEPTPSVTPTPPFFYEIEFPPVVHVGESFGFLTSIGDGCEIANSTADFFEFNALCTGTFQGDILFIFKVLLVDSGVKEVIISNPTTWTGGYSIPFDCHTTHEGYTSIRTDFESNTSWLVGIKDGQAVTTFYHPEDPTFEKILNENPSRFGNGYAFVFTSIYPGLNVEEQTTIAMCDDQLHPFRKLTIR